MITDVGLDSAVSMMTCYKLVGTGIESHWGRGFLYPSQLALWPTQPPIQWVPGLFPAEEQLGYGIDLPPPSNAEVKERVELHVYFPSGPSWPVLW